MLYLYDPRTNILSETNYSYLEDLTGKSDKNLMSYKSTGRKIRNINAYLTDDKVTLKQRREWYQKEKYQNEVWKPVQGSDGKFLISNYGRFQRVYKSRTGFLLPFLKKRTGYLEIKVAFNGRYCNHKISKLVAYHFVGKPKSGEVLHHKNSIITDDFSGNLEFITRTKLGKKTGFKSRSKPVMQLHRETMEVLGEFRSAREAGRECYLSYQAVLDNCNHKSKTSGGYVFMFVEEYADQYEDIECGTF